MDDKLFSSIFQKTLVIAPHPDDEVIGCGGVIARTKDSGCEVRVLIGTVNVNPDIFKPSRDKELRDCLNELGVSYCMVLAPGSNGRLDTMPIREIIKKIDEEIYDFEPTAVLIPYPSFHQDHKVMFEACMAATRPRSANLDIRIKLVALYEYPYSVWRYDEIKGGRVVVNIDRYIDRKVKALGMHKSQVLRSMDEMISPQNIINWARFRATGFGMRYAELFYVQRLEVI